MFKEIEIIFENSRNRDRDFDFGDRGHASYRPIPFEDVLTILVSMLVLLRDEKEGRVSVRLR